MEIITGVERRRRWCDEDKLRILAEADGPGAVIADVARRHGVSRSQIFDWRRKLQSGALSAGSVVPEFLPVRVQAAAPPMVTAEQPMASPVTGHLELSFPGGIRLRIEGKADAATVPVLAKTKIKTTIGRLWTYVRDDHPLGGPAPPAAIFHYSPDRSGKHTRAYLPDQQCG